MTPASVRGSPDEKNLPGARRPAVRVTVPAAEAELAADALFAAGAAAVEERGPRGLGGDVVLVAGPRAGDDADALLAAVAGRWLAQMVAVDLGAALDAWRAHARAVAIGPLVVRPPWVSRGTHSAPGEVEVVVDPGRAFGSGAHPSTQSALATLVDVVRGGERVLDLGCGSGVLALAAVRLGAAAALAVDLDAEAVAATRANAERNAVADRVTVVEADAAAMGEAAGSFDLVTANMLLPDLVAVAPAVAAALAPGGTAVLAGVLDDQSDAALAAYVAVGLRRAAEPRTADGWVALAVRPSS